MELELNANLLEEFRILKVVQSGKVSMNSLVQELPQYLAACDGISLSADVIHFWKERATLLPTFYSLFSWYCLPTIIGCRRESFLLAEQHVQ